MKGSQGIVIPFPSQMVFEANFEGLPAMVPKADSLLRYVPVPFMTPWCANLRVHTKFLFLLHVPHYTSFCDQATFCKNNMAQLAPGLDDKFKWPQLLCKEGCVSIHLPLFLPLLHSIASFHGGCSPKLPLSQQCKFCFNIVFI